MLDIFKKETELQANFIQYFAEDYFYPDLKYYQNRLKQIVNKHTEQDCFIDYHAGYSFVRDIESFLTDTVQK